MTQQYTGTLLGVIWMPACQAVMDVGRFDAEDDEDAADVIQTLKSGDFQEVTDYELWRQERAVKANARGLITEHTTRATLIHEMSEENQDQVMALIDPEPTEPAELDSTAWHGIAGEDHAHVDDDLGIHQHEPARHVGGRQSFTLVDDGTLDTVFQCDYCGAEERTNPEPGSDFDEGDNDARLAVALEWIEDSHECAS